MVSFLIAALSAISVLPLWRRAAALHELVDSLTGRVIALERDLDDVRLRRDGTEVQVPPSGRSRFGESRRRSAEVPPRVDGQLETTYEQIRRKPDPTRKPDEEIRLLARRSSNESSSGGGKPAPTSVDESLEATIGSRWLLYVGVVAIV